MSQGTAIGPRRAPASGDRARLEARVIGLLYVVIAVLAAFAEVYVRDAMIVSGDPAKTATNILAHMALYRAAGAADVVVLACDVAVAVLLYAVFKNVDRTVAQIAAAFRLSLVAINGAAVLTHLAPLMLLRPDGPVSSFPRDQLQSLALFSLRLHSSAFSVAIVFFGIHCVLVGYLISRSRFLPRMFGILWIVSGILYVTHSMLVLLAIRLPGSLADILLLIAGLAELSIVPWLLVVGLNPAKWETSSELGQSPGRRSQQMSKA